MTSPPSTAERTAAVVGPPQDVDPFDGFFHPGWSWSPRRGDLLDIPSARHWFETISWGMETRLYTYQLPVLNRTGPRVQFQGRTMIQMSSYDYLGLLGHPAIEAAAADAVHAYGTATGGVRLLAGTTELHRRLERELAEFKGTPAALTFGSGYMASLAVMTALFGPEDLVLGDARMHRSLVDGCRLAGVPLRSFRHNDVDSLRRQLAARRSGRTLIVVEGIYSMDGDLCPLPDIVALKREYGAFLLVDEAHSFGVLGPGGRGIDEHFGLPADCVDLWVGSLSKAVPSNGGFVAGSRELVIYLQHGAAPFMFSSAPCPAAVEAARAALAVVSEGRDRRQHAQQGAQALRDGLSALGYDTGSSASPIVPVIVGRDEAAYRLARDLYDQGILASAVVRPAVPRGRARLRLCVTAAHQPQDLEEVLEAFRSARGRNAPD